MEIDSDVFDKLSEEDQHKVLELLKKERAFECIDSYYEFFKEAWKVIEPSQPLVEAPHIKYLCDYLDKWTKMLEKKEKFPFREVIVNVPPASSKSSIITKIYPVWAWIRKPSFKILTSSFDQALVLDQTTKSRDIINSEWFQSWFGHLFKIKKDQNQKSSYYNTSTGFRLARTTKQGKTGFHFHIIIVDDPIDPKLALSETARTDAIHDREKVLPSRLIDGGLRITVMQRLHMSDPSGHALKKHGDKIFHVCLPAEEGDSIKPYDARKLYTNGLLDPDRLGKEALSSYFEDLGSREYTGQYLQSPFIDGGGEIKDEWFEYCERKDIPNLTWDLWIDGAYTEKTTNDPTGLMIAGYHKKTNFLYVRHFTSAYKILPDLLKFIDTYAVTYEIGRKSRVLIEPKASGKSIKQMINMKKGLSAIEIRGKLVNEGKKGRITTASPRVESGRVILVRGEWNEQFTSQLTGYPNHDHDEAVDLLGYACDRYFGKGSRNKMRKAN